MSFTGTQQKCKACEKTVYPMELLSADGVAYHKTCFKCFHCKGTLKVLIPFQSLTYLIFYNCFVNIVKNVVGNVYIYNC
jgi:hypothetical protein